MWELSVYSCAFCSVRHFLFVFLRFGRLILSQLKLLGVQWYIRFDTSAHPSPSVLCHSAQATSYHFASHSHLASGHLDCDFNINIYYWLACLGRKFIRLKPHITFTNRDRFISQWLIERSRNYHDTLDAKYHLQLERSKARVEIRRLLSRSWFCTAPRLLGKSNIWPISFFRSFYNTSCYVSVSKPAPFYVSTPKQLLFSEKRRNKILLDFACVEMCSNTFCESSLVFLISLTLKDLNTFKIHSFRQENMLEIIGISFMVLQSCFFHLSRLLIRQFMKELMLFLHSQRKWDSVRSFS